MLFKGFHFNDEFVEKYNQKFRGNFEPECFEAEIINMTCCHLRVDTIEEAVEKYGKEQVEKALNTTLEQATEILVYPETVNIMGFDIVKEYLDAVFPEGYEYTVEDPDFRRFMNSVICSAYCRLTGKDTDDADLIMRRYSPDEGRMYLLSGFVNIVLSDFVEQRKEYLKNKQKQ